MIHSEHKPSDDLKEVIATVILSIVGFSAFLAMPVIIGTLVDGYGVSESQAGYYGATGMVGGILAALLVSLLVTGVNRRVLLFTGLLIAAGANAVSAHVQGFGVLIALVFLVGLGGGIAYSVGIALISGTHHTGRNFSIMIFFQSGYSALVLYFLPHIVTIFGVPGMFFTLAGIVLLTMPLIFFVSPYCTSETDSPEVVTEAQDGNLAPWVYLGGIFFFSLAVGSFWGYVERLGVDRSISREVITNSLAAGNLAALVGCGVAFWLSERVGQVRPLLAGLVCLAGAFALMSTNIDQQTYIIGLFSFFLLWNFVEIFQLGTLSEVAHDGGRHAALVPAFQMVGAALGPGISGWLLARGWSLSGLVLLDSAAVVMAFLCAAFVSLILLMSKK